MELRKTTVPPSVNPHALQRHNTENSKKIFPGKELRGFSPNSYIHVSVSDLYIIRISPHAYFAAK
jgi:hypothetical protein